jgi:hypothetical protein
MVPHPNALFRRNIRSGHRAQEKPLQRIRERGPDRLGKVSMCAGGRRRSSLPPPILSPNALALRERQLFAIRGGFRPSRRPGIG